MITSLKNLTGKATTAFMLTLASAQHARAEVFGPSPDTGGDGDIHGAGTAIVDSILNVLGLIAVIVIVIAGVRLIIGGSDEAQREKARNTVLYAVLGLILVLFAKAIVAYVADNFTS